jgi:hypothetical protein
LLIINSEEGEGSLLNPNNLITLINLIKNLEEDECSLLNPRSSEPSARKAALLFPARV